MAIPPPGSYSRLDRAAMGVGSALGHATRVIGKVLDDPNTAPAVGTLVCASMDVAYSLKPGTFRAALIGAAAAFVETVTKVP